MTTIHGSAGSPRAKSPDKGIVSLKKRIFQPVACSSNAFANSKRIFDLPNPPAPYKTPTVPCPVAKARIRSSASFLPTKAHEWLKYFLGSNDHAKHSPADTNGETRRPSSPCFLL